MELFQGTHNILCVQNNMLLLFITNTMHGVCKILLLKKKKNVFKPNLLFCIIKTGIVSKMLIKIINELLLLLFSVKKYGAKKKYCFYIFFNEGHFCNPDLNYYSN